VALASLRDLNNDYMDGRHINERAAIFEKLGLRAAATAHAPARRLPASPESLALSLKSAAVGKRYAPPDFIADLLFYAAIFIILLSVLTSGADRGTPKVIMGWSYYTVLSGSMQDEIPKNSLILVKHTDPGSLMVGDNITFMSDHNKSVTHKIVEIYENYEDSGGRGFKTQGTNNPRPDDDIVYEVNVVGKVMLALPEAGALMRSFVTNVHLVYITIGLCLIFSFLIRGIFSKKPR